MSNKNNKKPETLGVVHTHTRYLQKENYVNRIVEQSGESYSLKNKITTRKQEKVLKNRKRVVVNSAIFTMFFVCIIAILVVAINSKKGNIEVASAENVETMQEQNNSKEQEKSLPKALTTITAKEPNTDNFTYVTSEDGIQVPVPNGYVASSIQDEMYVNGTYGTWKFRENLTLASPEGETYPWTQNATTGVWSSGNKGVKSTLSTIETNEFTLSEAGVIRINWSVCTSLDRSYLYYAIINMETGETINGTNERITGPFNGTTETSLIYENKDVILLAGTYKVRVIYQKTSSQDYYLDKGYLKSIGIYTKSADGPEITVREKKGGFVIYEKNAGETDEQAIEAIGENLNVAKTSRNQWVWVPISSSEVSNMYHISNGEIYGNYYNFSGSAYGLVKNGKREPVLLADYDNEQSYLKLYLEGINKNEFLQEIRERFYEMLESIATYGGFYIGRYETGNLSSKVPVIRKGNNNIDTINWYEMYKRCKNLKGANKSIQTGLIWGIQWDETMLWLINSRDKTCLEIGQNSSKWGALSSKHATGTIESAVANNIYDLAGNRFEWSMEADDSKTRYMRGGSVQQSQSAGYRYAHYSNSWHATPTQSGWLFGCRCTMILM